MLVTVVSSSSSRGEGGTEEAMEAESLLLETDGDRRGGAAGANNGKG